MDVDLEQDLRSNKTILQKCRNSHVYCQNLYAAMCNNRFFYNDIEWSCSWRHSGAIIADILNEGDYLDWYCSGMCAGKVDEYVPESVVTDEIRSDLLNMGWTIKPYEPRLKEGVYRNEW